MNVRTNPLFAGEWGLPRAGAKVTTPLPSSPEGGRGARVVTARPNPLFAQTPCPSQPPVRSERG